MKTRETKQYTSPSLPGIPHVFNLCLVLPNYCHHPLLYQLQALHLFNSTSWVAPNYRHFSLSLLKWLYLRLPLFLTWILATDFQSVFSPILMPELLINLPYWLTEWQFKMSKQHNIWGVLRYLPYASPPLLFSTCPGLSFISVPLHMPLPLFLMFSPIIYFPLVQLTLTCPSHPNRNFASCKFLLLMVTCPQHPKHIRWCDSSVFSQLPFLPVITAL